MCCYSDRPAAGGQPLTCDDLKRNRRRPESRVKAKSGSRAASASNLCFRAESFDLCAVLRSGNGRPYAFRPLRCICYARVLRAGKPQPLVRAAVRDVMRSRLSLRISARGLAVWSGRGGLVGRRALALANCPKRLIYAGSILAGLGARASTIRHSATVP